MMHACLVDVIVSILKEAGVPDMAVVTEARGLRAADATRHGVVVVLDLFGEGRHRVVDIVMTTICCNTILMHATSIPGYATKQVEDRKF